MITPRETEEIDDDSEEIIIVSSEEDDIELNENTEPETVFNETEDTMHQQALVDDDDDTGSLYEPTTSDSSSSSENDNVSERIAPRNTYYQCPLCKIRLPSWKFLLDHRSRGHNVRRMGVSSPKLRNVEPDVQALNLQNTYRQHDRNTGIKNLITLLKCLLIVMLLLALAILFYVAQNQSNLLQFTCNPRKMMNLLLKRLNE